MCIINHHTKTRFEFGWQKLCTIFVIFFFLFHFLFTAVVQGFFFWRFLILTNTGNPVISLTLPLALPLLIKVRRQFCAVVGKPLLLLRKSYRLTHRMCTTQDDLGSSNILLGERRKKQVRIRIILCVCLYKYRKYRNGNTTQWFPPMTVSNYNIFL